MNNDFKSGDIVVAKCGIFIFEESKETFFKVYCGLYNSGKIRDYHALIQYDGGERYATECEKKLLFDTFKKNGYKWYSRKKKLRNIKHFNVGDIIENKVTGKRLEVCCVTPPNPYSMTDDSYKYALCDIGTSVLNRYIKHEAFNNWKVVDF